MITSSNQQSNYHQRSISPLFFTFSDRYTYILYLLFFCLFLSTKPVFFSSSSSSLYYLCSNSASTSYNQRNHRLSIATETAATATTPILFHYNSYYNSPITSPLPSPHILNHHHIPQYYPQSSLMDSASYSPHLQQSPSPPISCLSVPGGNNNNHRGIRYVTFRKRVR